MTKLLLRAPILTASGYGVHSRQILKALLAPGRYDVSVMACNWGNTSYVLDDGPFFKKIHELIVKHEVEKREGRADYDVSVQVTIPNEFEKLARVNIGVTAGIEVDRASPEWINKANEKVDLVIVPSTHSRDTFAGITYQDQTGNKLSLQKPIVVCAEGVDTRYYNTVPLPTAAFEQFKFEAPFNYLFVGLGLDKPMGEDRKNLSHLIKWFCERFRDDPGVGLVIKGAIVGGSYADFEAFTARVRQIKEGTVGQSPYPRIHVVHGKLSDAEMGALYKHPKVKALVSLTHGEGFGLPLLEAAACGLPVVAMAWSGHLDFLTIDGKRKFVAVEHELGTIPQSAVWAGVMDEGTRWAVPKEEDAKLKLKKVVLSYDKPREWAEELAGHVATHYSEEHTAWQFINVLDSFLSHWRENNPQSEEEAVAPLRNRYSVDGKKTLLYTMPMSAGDVFISTAIISSLRKKYPDHAVFFATDPKYFDILKGNEDIDQVIPWEQWMANVPLTERVFDEVYTPNLAIQTLSANWVKRGKGRKLGEEMAHLCDVEFGEYRIQTEVPSDQLPEKYIAVCPGSGKGQWEARNYLYWQDVITNLGKLTGLPVVQVGTADEPEYRDCVDFRGKTKNYNELAHVVSSASLVVGIDSCQIHMAAAFAVPHVAIYGSSYASSTGPVTNYEEGSRLSVLIDTPSRYTCDKACYKYQCSVDPANPCINEIQPKKIVEEALWVLWGNDGRLPEKAKADVLSALERYEEFRPKLSGYTHVLNPERQGYPWEQSITSMLGFCDEVVVVDGGSDDGTRERLFEWANLDPKLQIIDHPWDWEEPGMDGMQKAFGRAMCSGDFLWQQDCDEVVHERDYEKVRNLLRRFPKDVDLLDLPVVELWGDTQHCRTDRHTWKWRLSRSNFRITHGINRDARVTDEKTGRTYAKKGQSDGCEYIDMMDYTYIQHKNFYTQELDRLRQSDPEKFGREMNRIYGEMPSVYHYSWANIPRKLRNFRDFWDKCWSNLYNDPAPQPRFPDVKTEEDIGQKAEELRLQGGEHGKASLFVLGHTNPAVMKDWVERIGSVI